MRLLHFMHDILTLLFIVSHMLGIFLADVINYYLIIYFYVLCIICNIINHFTDGNLQPCSLQKPHISHFKW